MKTIFRGLVFASMVYCSVGLGVAGFAIANGDATAATESGAKGKAQSKAQSKAKPKGDDALRFEVLERAVLWPLRIFD